MKTFAARIRTLRWNIWRFQKFVSISKILSVLFCGRVQSQLTDFYHSGNIGLTALGKSTKSRTQQSIGLAGQSRLRKTINAWRRAWFECLKNLLQSARDVRNCVRISPTEKHLLSAVRMFSIISCIRIEPSIHTYPRAGSCLRMRESREILLTHQVRTSDAVRPFQRYFMIHLLHEALGRAKLNLVVSLQPIDSILISGACLEETKTIVTVLCSVHLYCVYRCLSLPSHISNCHSYRFWFVVCPCFCLCRLVLIRVLLCLTVILFNILVLHQLSDFTEKIVSKWPRMCWKGWRIGLGLLHGKTDWYMAWSAWQQHH